MREKMVRNLVHGLLDQLSVEEVNRIGLVINEMNSAKRKHPAWPSDQIHAAAIVAEEAGELVRAALQFTYEGGRPEEMRDEAAHTAATAIRMLVHLPVELPDGTMA